MAGRVKDTNNIPKLIKQLELMDKFKTIIGIQAPSGDDLYKIGYVQEYGFDIKVTDGMRNWFLAQGMPLTADTTHIRIPERSYLRTAFDLNQAKIHRKMEDLALKVANGEMTAYQAREALGPYVSEMIKLKIDDVQLIRSGELRESIGHIVKVKK